jgi:hypothetical protein
LAAIVRALLPLAGALRAACSSKQRMQCPQVDVVALRAVFEIVFSVACVSAGGVSGERGACDVRRPNGAVGECCSCSGEASYAPQSDSDTFRGGRHIFGAVFAQCKGGGLHESFL